MEYKKNTNFQNIYAYSSPKESARFSRNEITRVTNILFSGCFRGEKKKNSWRGRVSRLDDQGDGGWRTSDNVSTNERNPYECVYECVRASMCRIIASAARNSRSDRQRRVVGRKAYYRIPSVVSGRIRAEYREQRTFRRNRNDPFPSIDTIGRDAGRK